MNNASYTFSFLWTGALIRTAFAGTSPDLKSSAKPSYRRQLSQFTVKKVCGGAFLLLAVDEERKLYVLILFEWCSNQWSWHRALKNRRQLAEFAAKDVRGGTSLLLGVDEARMVVPSALALIKSATTNLVINRNRVHCICVVIC
ncbi:hypothetical protein T4A_14369 [Trichinella pseudospiralis]|uniref:Uncharacterized protein n=1 Tax=Trichinella pseudospiralis TaxID=6337 RepID=A0A0V1ER65_TRIPS|nr:hypothetical protein T4A_14369 [Trichinella pseudospiralis]